MGPLGSQSKQLYTTLLRMPSLSHILHWLLFSLRNGKSLSRKHADGGASSKGCGSTPAGRQGKRFVNSGLLSSDLWARLFDPCVLWQHSRCSSSARTEPGEQWINSYRIKENGLSTVLVWSWCIQLMQSCHVR